MGELTVIESAGVGLSVEGRIPLAASHDWGLDGTPSISGHVFAAGRFALPVVPALAARFTDRPLEAGLVEALMTHPWPLNARGLAAVLARAAIVRPDGPLKLDGAVREALALDRALTASAPAPAAESAPTPAPPRDPPEAAELAAALTAHRGRIAPTARALDASRQQIYRWITLHGLELGDFRR